MGLLEWRFGRAALSSCSVVDSVCRASVMSMSCSMSVNELFIGGIYFSSDK